MFVTDSSQLTANALVEIIKSIAEHQLEVPVFRFVHKIRQLEGVDVNDFVNERGDCKQDPNQRLDGQPDVQAVFQAEAKAASRLPGKCLRPLMEVNRRHGIHFHVQTLQVPALN